MPKFPNEKEPWQEDPTNYDWLYDVDWDDDDEEDGADWWKPLEQWADDYSDDDLMHCDICGAEFDDLFDEFEWFEHICEHEYHDWWKLGKLGRQKWINFVRGLGTSIPAKDLFNMAYLDAVIKGEKPPFTPYEAVKRGLIETDSLPRDRDERKKEKCIIRNSWRKLGKSGRALWNELRRRITIATEIYYITPQEMSSLRAGRNEGYLLYKIIYHYAKNHNKTFLPHPRKAYEAGLLEDIHFSIPTIWKNLEKINDNSWAIEYQKRNKIIPYNQKMQEF